MTTFGLDLHGVIDSEPDKYVRFARTLRAGGGRIIICTGSSEVSIQDQLLFYGEGEQWWDEVFSITDYLVAKGIPHTPTADGGIQVENDVWDRVKGEWAAEHHIDFHIDDSPVYGRFFPDGVYLKVNNRVDREVEKVKEPRETKCYSCMDTGRYQLCPNAENGFRTEYRSCTCRADRL